jgi:hypothetical protein
MLASITSFYKPAIKFTGVQGSPRLSIESAQYAYNPQIKYNHPYITLRERFVNTVFKALPKNLFPLFTSAYNWVPLPFQDTGEESHGKGRGIGPDLTWKNFEQDKTGKFVYLYRGVGDMTKEQVAQSAHLSHAAAMGITKQAIYDQARQYWNSQAIDAYFICCRSSDHKVKRHFNYRPVLHTTRSKETAKWIGNQWCQNKGTGTIITYKIPKTWLLEKHFSQDEHRPITGNGLEKEIDFFYSLPTEFVHCVET